MYLAIARAMCISGFFLRQVFFLGVLVCWRFVSFFVCLFILYICLGSCVILGVVVVVVVFVFVCVFFWGGVDVFIGLFLIQSITPYVKLHNTVSVIWYRFYNLLQ